ncbi:UPF0158 family protein [Thalassobacillus devorans]|uniref:UPF0158 family protein n=1 Tax=Thalassobacillus devorans TaxID=279813 RepID=UPI0004B874A4|nr:UPF0158 family protein [Thalassobacillus devorans]
MIKLKEIAESMALQMDEFYTFFDKESCKFILISEESLQSAEDMEPFDHLPEWQQEEREWANLCLEYPKRFVSLPDKFVIDEYGMMKEFIFHLKDDKQKNQLLRAIQGRGVFRRFKDLINRWNIDREWYQFREEEYEKIAQEWCEENDIEYKL